MINNQRGFSMLELMIGLLIMSILIAAVVGIGGISVTKYRNFSTAKDLRVYTNAAELYVLENSGKDLTEAGFNKYLEGSYKFEDGLSFRKNPWKNPYILYSMFDYSNYSPGFIYVYSNIHEAPDSPPETRIGYVHNYLDGLVYYYRGETATCITHSTDLSQEDLKVVLQEVIVLLGEQEENFACGDYPVYD